MEQNKNQDGAQKRTVPVESIAQRMVERMNQTKETANGKKGALIVIDSQPPVGDNTTIMLYMVELEAVRQQKPVAYFSPELSNVQVVNRLIAIHTGIDREKIESGMLSREEWDTLDRRIPQLMEAPLYVDDTPQPTVASLQEKVTALTKDHGVRLVIVNPVNLVDADGHSFDSEEDRLGWINRSLIKLSEDLGIAIFAIQD